MKTQKREETATRDITLVGDGAKKAEGKTRVTQPLAGHWMEGTTPRGQTAQPLVISGNASHRLDEVPETTRYEVAARIGS